MKCDHVRVACDRCRAIILTFRWSKAPICVACDMRDIEMARLERKYEND